MSVFIRRENPFGTTILPFKTTPYWWETVEPLKVENKEIPTQIDVAIIGSGYTGLWASIILKEKGLNVHVFEAKELGYGASTRNAGFVGSGYKLGVSKLFKIYGKDKAVELYNISLKARKDIEETIRKENIDCGFVVPGHLVAAWKPRHLANLERTAELLEKYFSLKTRLLDKASLSACMETDLYHGGLFLADGALLNPAHYYQGVLTLAINKGVNFHLQTEVQQIEQKRGKFEVTLSGKKRTLASEVLIATNGYTSSSFPEIQRRIIPLPSTIVLTEPIDQHLLERLIHTKSAVYDTKNFLYYFRFLDDGKLLFGGRTHLSFGSSITEAAKELLRSIYMVFPALKEIKIRNVWEGKVCFTLDQLPHYGRLTNGIHYCLGYCGHGVALASYLGKLTAYYLLNDPRGQSSLLTLPFKKGFFYKTPPWSLPLIGLWYRLKDALF
ncbi:FAD-binding oxidoreductase [Candidatus Methylacidiphilum fumarolicum]|uniref:Glycine/d-amino acid oxidases (Deaminating) n=2 Tax=Candidatus Methylacidiphilum fumarolicum TaxID=591154 RepID=A0ABN8XIP8_9BACT|nr:FAD-dependent oxidoreductase [Candidatus Methylacidiphilum fumarolicum]MBW6415264.1 FAD-binding oxidoreductase [Candidatus Methylacidiphilum fumarolicum]TFE69245.1 hypothetical protein A7K73_06195 [Candidatus Methylacidiphilum fumarolicum]TFE72231.1 FAD-binding oxidoreductase [Candidatus Methylacidiphilum fumarolicum]TFE72372.1 FAD-binding oxidoreductase [Candidatus Methylacidiphilum fumarolicum]TFE76971.1 hypothetical protein A7D33_07110 [Candidatus Methylacidiphilum fumarolicum]